MNDSPANALRRIVDTMCFLSLVSTPMVAAARARNYEQNSETVRYNPVALKTPAGRATFERRIRQAAANVCGPTPGPAISDYQTVEDCRNAAVASAHAKIARVQERTLVTVALTESARR
jgi:UrcA family protein